MNTLSTCKDLITKIKNAKRVFALVKVNADNEAYLRIYKDDAIATLKTITNGNPDTLLEISEDEKGNLYLGW